MAKITSSASILTGSGPRDRKSVHLEYVEDSNDILLQIGDHISQERAHLTLDEAQELSQLLSRIVALAKEGS